MHQRAHLVRLESAVEVGDTSERAFEYITISVADVDDVSIKKSWERVLVNQTMDFYAGGVMKLQENYDNCVRLERDYVEKCDFKLDFDVCW